jgi:predicted PurR-regulated permease PerM
MDARVPRKPARNTSPEAIGMPRQQRNFQHAEQRLQQQRNQHPAGTVHAGRWSRYWLGVEDTNPLSESSAFWRGLMRGATIGLFVIALLVVMYYARPVLLPITLAFTLGIVLTPLTTRGLRYGIPAPLSAVLVVAAFAAIASSVVVLLSDAIREWIVKAPEFIPVLKERFQFIERPWIALNSLRESIAGPADPNKPAISFDLASILQPALGYLTPAVGQLIVFLGTLIFFLSDPNSLKEYVVSFVRGRESRLRALRIVKDVERNLVGHFGVVTAVNLCLGIALAIATAVIGLPNPLVWGVMAAVLNYVPYIGAGVVIACLFVVGLVSFDTLSQALVAPGFYLVLATIEGQFIVPSILGRRLTLNPLTIFVAIAFWGWMWGAFGALLAVPLLIVGLVLMKHIFPKSDVKLPG